MSGDAAPKAVQPLYPRLASDPFQPWRARADWAVCQRVDHPDPEAANRLAMLDLQGGADALTLVAGASRAAHGYGLPEPSALAATLEGVELDLIGLRLDAGAQAPAFAEALAALVEARRLGSAGLGIDLGFDPVALAACGQEAEPGAASALVRLAAEAGLAGRPLLCDGRTWHEAGAGEARELALVLASGVSEWRQLEAAGHSLEAARDAVAVLLPFEADVLMGLAKARAVRRLWVRLETACGLQPKPLKLHAETSWRMMTRYDTHTNAMRATAAVFAAGLGGVDTMSVLPMTLVQGLPDEAARRLARNTGRVLLDEANLGKVDDPAAGSGALEALTEDLCRAAWSLFQDVERSGGIEAGLRNGSIAAFLATEAARRRGEVASLARGLVGTSLFPSLDAPAAAVLDLARTTAPQTNGTLPSHRDAEPFETLRDIAEIRAGIGRRPRAFLATLGEPAAFGARATLAANLLAAAGIATEPPPAAARDMPALVIAFEASGTPVACLCGDDAAYAANGEAAAAALRQAGATWVLAASSGEVEGADGFIHKGGNVLQILAATLKILESQSRSD